MQLAPLPLAFRRSGLTATVVVFVAAIGLLEAGQTAAATNGGVTTFHSALSRGGSVAMHVKPGKADGSLVVKDVSVANVPLRCMVANGESVTQHSDVFSKASLPVNKTLLLAQPITNVRAHELTVLSENYGTGFPSWALTVKILTIAPHRVNVYVQVESYPAEYTSCYADTPHAVKKFHPPS